MKHLFYLLLLISCSANTTTENDIKKEQETDVKNKVLKIDYADLEDLPLSSSYDKEVFLNGVTNSPFGYVVRKPEGFGKDGLEYPILIFLHGVGSRGNSANNPNDINKVDKDGAIRAIKLGLWSPVVPVPVFVPQTSSDWNPTQVKNFINYLKEAYKGAVNENRIYLGGFSMGGYGVWSYLDKYDYTTNQIAGALTLAGAKEDSGKNISDLEEMPFWVFHGKKDPTVSYTGSLDVVSKFRSTYNLQEHQKLTLFNQDDFEGQYHRIDHGVFDTTFWDKNTTGDVFDVNIMNWLLQYKRAN